MSEASATTGTAADPGLQQQASTIASADEDAVNASTSIDYLDLCRLCLQKDSVNLSIFEEEGEQRQMFLKISATLPVKIFKEDKLPKKICDDCSYKVELLYQFWNTAATSEKQLLQWLGEIGLDDKQNYEVLEEDLMKSEKGNDNRLNTNIIQVSDQNSIEISMIDNISLITIPAGSEQFTTVPIDASGTIQTEAMQSSHDQSQIEEDRSEMGDMSDDGCDNEGLPVKEESDDQNNQANMDQAYVSIEAGPSGIQHQKISELTIQQAADGDPKTGKMERNFAWSNKLSEDSFQILDLMNSETFLEVKKEEPELNISDVEEYVEEDEDCVDDAFEEVDIEGTVYTIEDSEEENAEVDESLSPARKKAKMSERFHCSSCDLFFSSTAELQEHNETHDKPGFIPPRQYHGYRRDKYGIYSCDTCYFESPGIMAMKLHLSRKHDNFIDPDDQDSNYSNVWGSNETSRDGLKLSGPEDDDDSQDNSNLLGVAGNSRGKNKAAIDSSPKSDDDYDKMNDGFPRTRTEYRCQYCDFTSISRAAMATHLLKEHGDDWNAAVALRQEEVREFAQGKSENILACLYCSFAATSRSTLAAHTRRKHHGYLQAYQVEPKSRQFKAKVDLRCDKCDFVTQCKHKLATHVGRKHTTELNFPCHYCGKRFKMKVDVAAHIKMQHEQTPHICDVCGKVVGSANALHIHQKREHFQPEFQCHLCRRRMVSQENLDEHMVRQHENAPKYQCEQCGKIFGQPCKLKQHMRTHTGERPHTCHKCGKSFARRSVFRQHMLIHTGQRPYVCDICGKSFTQKPGLICHRKSHPGEKPPLPVVYIDSILTDFVNNDLNDAKQPEEIIEETVNFDDCLMED